MTGVERSRPARIVMVGPHPGAQGGIASVISTLLSSSIADKYDVKMIATSVDGNVLCRALAGALGVIRAVREARPGVILHVHMASRGSFLRKGAIVILAHRRGARVVLHLHGGRFHLFAESRGALGKRMIVEVFGRADVVLVLSPEWQERVRAITGRHDTIVLPNPVAVPRVRADDHGVTQVVFLGRVGERKGVPELLDAIGQLQRAGHDEVRWIVAGDGDLTGFVQRSRRLPEPSRVEFPGWVTHEEAVDLLARSSAFVLPSYDEGKPVALLEAMSYGLPCVVTPVGGVPDLVSNMCNGLLVPAGDVEGLADALRRLLEDPDLRERLGATARRTIIGKYSIDVVERELTAIYDSLLEAV